MGSVVYTDIAMNTVVLKCHVGTAQAACAAVDSIGLPEVCGTIAGDDTAFIAMKDNSSANSFYKEIEQLF